MGLFDFLKKKPQKDTIDTNTIIDAHDSTSIPSTSWSQKLSNFHEWDSDEQKSICTEFLGELGNSLDSAKVSESLSSGVTILKGKLNTVPIKVEVDTDIACVHVDTKCHVPFEEISLEWNLEKIPVSSDDDFDNDDWDEEDEVRIFLAKGVYCERPKSQAENIITEFSKLDQIIRDDILDTLPNYKLSNFRIKDNLVHVFFSENLYEMSSPIESVKDVVSFTSRIANALESMPIGNASSAKQTSDGSSVAVVPLQFVRCNYCSSQFNLGFHSRCPNCGAPYSDTL